MPDVPTCPYPGCEASPMFVTRAYTRCPKRPVWVCVSCRGIVAKPKPQKRRQNKRQRRETSGRRPPRRS